MGVGAGRIHIKEVRHTEFAEANFEASSRQFIEQR